MIKNCISSLGPIVAASLSAAMLTTAPAVAALSEADLLAPGDNLLTFDDETCLEWLDLTETDGMSFDEVMEDMEGFIDLGFRYATLSEVEGLFAAANIVDLFGTPTSTDSDSVFTNLSELQALIGITSTIGFGDPFLFSNGIHLPDAGPALPSILDIVATTTGGPAEIATITSDTIASDESMPNIGSFLVRDTKTPLPEPGAVLGLGAMALVGALTTKKATDRKNG